MPVRDNSLMIRFCQIVSVISVLGLRVLGCGMFGLRVFSLRDLPGSLIHRVMDHVLAISRFVHSLNHRRLIHHRLHHLVGR